MSSRNHSGELGASPLETPVPVGAIQDQFVAAIRAYAERVQAGERFPPFLEGQVTQTDAAIAASGILKAADVELFELAMWNAWGVG